MYRLTSYQFNRVGNGGIDGIKTIIPFSLIPDDGIV